MAQLPRHLTQRARAAPGSTGVQHYTVPRTGREHGPAATSPPSESLNIGEHGPAATSPNPTGPRCPSGRLPFSMAQQPRQYGPAAPRATSEFPITREHGPAATSSHPLGPALPHGLLTTQYLFSTQGTEPPALHNTTHANSRAIAPGPHLQGTTNCR